MSGQHRRPTDVYRAWALLIISGILVMAMFIVLMLIPHGFVL